MIDRYPKKISTPVAEDMHVTMKQIATDKHQPLAEIVRDLFAAFIKKESKQ